MGLPVFAAGSLGVVYLLGPTGGYILGFIPATYIVGYTTDNGWNKNLITILISMIVGTSIVFVFGVSWLSFSAGLTTAITIGLLPYLPGALIKISLAALLIYSINRTPK